ncbi:MAG: hypothetical protein CMI27_04770 [Opitutae bacterium]|nr:hypothetical protein [Opitutae bacterium]
MITKITYLFIIAHLSGIYARAAPKFETLLIKDLPYADSNNPKQELDLLLPLGTTGNSTKPLVVWIHGGGWKSGDRKSGMRSNRLPQIVSTGKFIGASISYRLSGQSRWPAQIHDCKAAIRWLRGNALKYGIDTERIAVWGSSAGGHLAAMLGLTSGVQELEGGIGNHRMQSTRIHAVVNYYGPSSFLTMDDFPGKIIHNSSHSPESMLIGGPVQKRKKIARQASPISHVSPDDCPHLLFHGIQDPLVPSNQSEILRQSLAKNRVAHALISVRPGKHSMPSSFTNQFVLPFLLHQFFGVGDFPKDQVIQN